MSQGTVASKGYSMQGCKGHRSHINKIEALLPIGNHQDFWIMQSPKVLPDNILWSKCCHRCSNGVVSVIPHMLKTVVLHFIGCRPHGRQQHSGSVDAGIVSAAPGCLHHLRPRGSLQWCHLLESSHHLHLLGCVQRHSPPPRVLVWLGRQGRLTSVALPVCFPHT